ncbi:MauE/DoxX family redox-associated membrane protein [Brevibacillus brevis]|uniref:MauE/DoxX family redox-associated membrane protein n=1 Tax=Brevibacillus brevis TaxID=1393 RepID=UPI0037C0176E
MLLISQTLLIVTFLMSGLAKIIRIKDFHNTLSQLNHSAMIVKLALFTVPSAEIITSILLFNKNTIVYGLILIFALSLTFIIETIRILRLKKDVECNCFGTIINEKMNLVTIIKNIIILFISLYLLFNGNTVFEYSYKVSEIISAVLFVIGVHLIYFTLANIYNIINVKEDVQ